MKFDQVLFVGGDEAKIGTPVVAGASVEGKVLAQVKGQKIVVYKYKAKKNERKKQGHRQPYTKVEITAVNVVSSVPSEFSRATRSRVTPLTVTNPPATSNFESP